MTFTFVAHDLELKHKKMVKTLKHLFRAKTNGELLKKLIESTYDEISYF